MKNKSFELVNKYKWCENAVVQKTTLISTDNDMILTDSILKIKDKEDYINLAESWRII